MTVRRAGDTIFLEGVCAVEDAEALLQHLQTGADLIDWCGCSHLHAACFQMVLIARLPMKGPPANPEIARWLEPILHSIEMPSVQVVEAEPVFELEN
ncbi:hypothetical protein [Rhodopseudomonas sp. P2A-2r]|uniref:hypothetical protein n=1 Tax=unclassified Rhodopseudomonas TaxID=2638247 RepID=UPI002234144A|nr:hypothetical protein [Rhodopseudomonas sp. P2A-2r]UZE49014.1 hypothetical protein ONR75_30575 [Rhodopseudomonas sp. P2A-2r]